MCIILERVSTSLAVCDPRPGAGTFGDNCTFSVWRWGHRGLVLSGLRCWAELVDGVIMNKLRQVHEKCSRVHPEISDSAFMSPAISSAFSHGWGLRLGSRHFFSGPRANVAVRQRQKGRIWQHLCLRLTAASSPPGTVCGSFLTSVCSLVCVLQNSDRKWKSTTVMKRASAGTELWTVCLCNILNHLSTWMSLFPPLQEFFPLFYI